MVCVEDSWSFRLSFCDVVGSKVELRLMLDSLIERQFMLVERLVGGEGSSGCHRGRGQILPPAAQNELWRLEATVSTRESL